MKTNIIIRVKVFGWKELHIICTHQGVKSPLVELSDNLRKIIRFEKNVIPTEPRTKISKRRPMPILGTMTDDRRKLDQKHLDTKKNVREVAEKLSR